VKITKRQLRRIIKEEKRQLRKEAYMSLDPHHSPGTAWKKDSVQKRGVQEGVSRGVYTSVWNYLEEHAAELQLNLEDRSIVASVVDGLEKIVRELKDKVRGPTR